MAKHRLVKWMAQWFEHGCSTPEPFPRGFRNCCKYIINYPLHEVGMLLTSDIERFLQESPKWKMLFIIEGRNFEMMTNLVTVTSMLDIPLMLENIPKEMELKAQNLNNIKMVRLLARRRCEKKV